MSDFSELMKLAQDLSNAPAEASENVRKAVEVTALKVKKDWQKGASRGPAGYAADVSYQITGISGSGVQAEIGPTPGDIGSLGILEDAPGGVRSAPQHAGRDAAKNNAEDFAKGLGLAVSDFL